MKNAPEFLEEMARYFESRPTDGEDRAHWANIYNAEYCRKLAAMIPHTQKAILKSVEAVRDYLPPDGIGKDEFITRIIEAVDNPDIAPVIERIEAEAAQEQALARWEDRRDAMLYGMSVKRKNLGGYDVRVDPADIYHTLPAEIEGRGEPS